MRLLQFLSLFIVMQSGIWAQNLDSLNQELAVIYQLDQEIRFEFIRLIQENKMQTDSFELVKNNMLSIDSANLVKVKTMVETYGWPDGLNTQANQTIFLVIQHADLATQKAYLPMMRKAVKAGKISAGSLAILEDRVALRSGKKQIYGSQVLIDQASGTQEVQPIRRVRMVDRRRKSVGLPPMTTYLKDSFNMTWDYQAYKAALPDLNKKLKAKRKS